MKSRFLAALVSLLFLQAVQLRAETMKFVTVYPAPFGNYAVMKTPQVTLSDTGGSMTFTPGSITTSEPVNIKGAGSVQLRGNTVAVSAPGGLTVNAGQSASISPAGIGSATASSEAAIRATSALGISANGGSGTVSVANATGSGNLVVAGRVYNGKGWLIRQCPGGKLIPDGGTCPAVTCPGATTYTSKQCSGDTNYIALPSRVNQTVNQCKSSRSTTPTFYNYSSNAVEASWKDTSGLRCFTEQAANEVTSYEPTDGITTVDTGLGETVSCLNHYQLAGNIVDDGRESTRKFLYSEYTVVWTKVVNGKISCWPRTTATTYYDCTGSCKATAPVTVSENDTCAKKTYAAYFTTNSGTDGAYLDCTNKCTAASAPSCAGVPVGRLLTAVTTKACTAQTCVNYTATATACTASQQSACNAGGTCSYTTTCAAPPVTPIDDGCSDPCAVKIGNICRTITCTNGSLDKNTCQCVSNEVTCFPAGTMVAVRGGSTPIEKLAAGSEILAPTQNGGIAVSHVRELIKKTGPLFIITTDRGVLKTTLDHPLRRPDGSYTKAGELHTGDRISYLVGVTLVDATIGMTQELPDPVAVYNLSADEPHAFFADNFAVHNKTREQDIPSCTRGATWDATRKCCLNADHICVSEGYSDY